MIILLFLLLTYFTSIVIIWSDQIVVMFTEKLNIMLIVK